MRVSKAKWETGASQSALPVGEYPWHWGPRGHVHSIVSEEGSLAPCRNSSLQVVLCDPVISQRRELEAWVSSGCVRSTEPDRAYPNAASKVEIGISEPVCVPGAVRNSPG